MPVSGLMITLVNDSDASQCAIQALQRHVALELGLQEGPRLAAVLDTRSEDENKNIWRWLNDLHGVAHVDVIFVALEHDEEAPTHHSAAATAAAGGVT